MFYTYICIFLLGACHSNMFASEQADADFDSEAINNLLLHAQKKLRDNYDYCGAIRMKENGLLKNNSAIYLKQNMHLIKQFSLQKAAAVYQ